VTPDEYVELLAQYRELRQEYGGIVEAAVANPDRRDEIVDIAVRVEHEAWRRSTEAIAPPTGKRSYDARIERVLRAKHEAERQEQADRLRDLLEDALAASADAPVFQRHLAGREPDLVGKPLPAVPTLEALRTYAGGGSIHGATQEELGFSFRSARRVHSWHASGVVRWDRAQGKVVVAAGYRLVQGGTKAKPTLQLVRTDPF
jgi:hypothetical protein